MIIFKKINEKHIDKIFNLRPGLPGKNGHHQGQKRTLIKNYL